jgi:Tfp pilus assembly protein PilZ
MNVRRGNAILTPVREDVETEHRAHPRYEVDAGASLTGTAPQKIHNLSLGGICIETSVLTEVGTDVDVVLHFRTGEDLSLRGQVVWVNRRPPEDVGIRWLDLDADHRDLLARHLAAALESSAAAPHAAPRRG